MDKDCSHCGCHHADIKFNSRLRRKRCLVSKNLQTEIGQSSTKWFDELTEQSVQKSSTTDDKPWTPAANVEKSPASGQHSFQAVTPGGATLTPQSTWAMFATQDTSTPKLSLPLVGISPAFVSTPKMNASVSMSTDLSRELGGNDSVISWTSSMATPCLKRDMTVDLHDECEEISYDKLETVTRTKGLPRMLFTPDRSGLESEEFARILEESREETPGVNVSPDLSPVLNKRVNKRLSLRTKCEFLETDTPTKTEDSLANSDDRVCSKGEAEKQIKSDSSEVQNAGLLSPSSTNSVIVSVLSPFFDSPTSEKRCAAPKGVKRKAAELIPVDDDLSVSCESSPSQSQTGPQSILSSANKRTVSERKRVRFAADVETSDKNSRSRRKHKTFCSKDVSCVEKKPECEKVHSSDNTASDLLLKIVNLNINNSCAVSERTGNTSSIDILSNEKSVDLKSDDISNRFNSEEMYQENKAKHSSSSVVNLTDLNKCNEILSSIENQKKGENTSDLVEKISPPVSESSLADQKSLIFAGVKTAPGDDLFSQVSQSALTEMCQSASNETSKSDRVSDTCEPKSAEPSKPVLETGIMPSDISKTKSIDSKAASGLPKLESKKFQKPRRFLYPSGSQISQVCPEKIFNFHSLTPESNKKPDVSTIHEIKDEKWHQKEDLRLKKETSSNNSSINIICEDKSNVKPPVSPTKLGSNCMIEPCHNSEQDVPAVRTIPRQRNCIEFKKFSEMFASDMVDISVSTREMNEPLKTLTNQVTALRDNMNKYDRLESEVGEKAQSVQTNRSNIGFLSADELCGSEEPEEKNDYDFDMNTQEVENFVKDVFLDDMEFSQVTMVNKHGSCNDDMATTETHNKTDVDDDLIRPETDTEFPDECSHNLDKTLNEADAKLASSFSEGTHSKSESAKHSECLYSVVDEDIAFRRVGSMNKSKASYPMPDVNKADVSSANEAVGQKAKCTDELSVAGGHCVKHCSIDNTVTDDVKHLECSGLSEKPLPSFSTASGKAMEFNQSALKKAQALLECDEMKLTSKSTFSTTSDEKVKINQDPLDKAQALIQHKEEDMGSLKCLHSSEESGSSFATASGKPMKHNQTVKHLLECEQSVVESLKCTDHLDKSYPSFSTAGGKSIKLNQSALKKAQALLELEENKPQLPTASEISDRTLSTFSTAGGKTVKINQRALQKAQNVLESGQNEFESLKCLDPNEGSSVSFSTASGKAMKFHEKSLYKDQTVLVLHDDVESFSKSDCSSVTNKHLKGNEDSKAISPSKIDINANNAPRIDHSIINMVVEMDSTSESKSGLSVTNKNSNQAKAANMSSSQLNITDSKDIDNFEEILLSIVANKKKCAAVKPALSFVPKQMEQRGFQAISRNDPMLKPKGFRPFKKPKRIVVQKPSVDSSAKTAVHRDHNKISTDCDEDIKQPCVQNSKHQQEKNIKTDMSDSQMSEMMLKEFSHDIFSQCQSQGSSSQSNKLTTAEDALSYLNEDYSPLKDCRAQSSNSTLTSEKDKITKSSDQTNNCIHHGSELKSQLKDSQLGCLGQGFQLASGRKVHVSEKSLLKAQNVLTDINSENLELVIPEHKKIFENEQVSSVITDSYSKNQNNVKVICSSGLALKESKPVYPDISKDFESEDTFAKQNISDETITLQHLHHLLTDDTLFEDNINNDSETVITNCKKSGVYEKSFTDESDVFTSNVTPSNSGQFQTASGTDVTLSADSLTHAQSLLKDGSSNKEMSKPSGFFKTASGKEVTISKASLKHAKSLWMEESNVPIDQDIYAAATIKNISTVPTGLFQTASGKAVDISKESLEHAKSLWNNESNILEGNNSTTGLFPTASGKDVIVCKESQSQAKSLWTDEFSYEITNSHKVLLQTASGKDVTVSRASLDHVTSLWQNQSKDISGEPANCFQIASGKKVSVSESALDSANYLVQDKPTVSTSEDSFSEPKILFHTASGKNVTVSKTALDCAKSLWKDETQTVTGQDLSSEPTASFQTASRKSVSVSEESLDHSKTLWENSSAVPTENAILNSTACFFQTSLGKDVAISREPLVHGKSLFNDEYSSNSRSDLFHTESDKEVITSKVSHGVPDSLLRNESYTIAHNTSSASTVKNTSKGSAGLFQTASGKAVGVSKESLERAKTLWKNESAVLTSKDICNAPTSLFQTASGKGVSISKSSLDHAKSLWKDETKISLDQDSSKAPTTLFQTASGKDVAISKSSLDHAKSLWKEETQTSQGTSRLPASLFQTASGKDVAISKSSLDHSKSMWKDDCSALTDNEMTLQTVVKQSWSDKNLSDSEAQSLWKPDSSSVLNMKKSACMFQTALGSKISVSKDALHKARHLWKDESDSINPETDSCGKPCLVQTATGSATSVGIMAELVNHSSDRFDNGSRFDDVSVDSVNNDSIDEAIQHIQNVSKADKSPRCVSDKTDVLCQKWDRTADVQDKGRDFTQSVQHSEIQRKMNKKGLQSTLEAFHTDRWSTGGKRFEPLHCDNLTTRSNEYFLENIVGCKPEPVLSSSSFKTPYKKSPFVPMAQKATDSTETKKTKTPVFCPKSAIKYAQQSSSKEIPSHPVSSEKELPVVDSSDTSTEEKPSSRKLSVVEARKQQEEKIALKKKQKVKPVCGRLAAVKSSCCRYKYSDLSLHTGCSVQELVSMGVMSTTMDISSQTAQSYRFSLRQFYPSVQSHVLVGDGAFLVPDDDGFAGSEEFYRAFLMMEGVDPSLVSDVWVTNHYRWIVWKLAAYEVAFPHQFAGRSLSPDSVMLQLKYRYDKEIDNCHRSCLKKIMERDDTACKRMVLCVSAIVTTSTESKDKQHTPNQEMFLELTDGWYCIKGKMDGALLEMVERKRIVVGQKLCISGAELGGSEEACSPLEAPASLFLKLSLNSTRPASWDSRLGYQHDPRPLCVSVSSLHPSGGLVGGVDAVVVRVYPVMYMEKIEGGAPIFRTAECEERVQRQFDHSRQEQMEKLYEKIQVQFEQEENQESRRSRRRLTRQDIASLQSGSEIWDAVQSSLHPEELHSWLSVEQQQLMEEFQRSRHEQRQQQLQSEFYKAWEETHGEETTRKVTPVLKIRIAGCARRDIDSKLTTLVTVWRPGPDWLDIREGKRYKFFGLVASSAKTRLSSHSVHLTASRQTRIKELHIEENYLDLIYEPREVWKVRDLRCRIPPNKEFDFVGIVIEVSSNSDKRLDTVYVSDIEGDLMTIRFWGGVQTFGLTDFQEGRLFVGRNLLLKWSRGPGVISAEACIEVSQFSHTGSSQEERKHLDKLKSVSQTDKAEFLKKAKSKLLHIQGVQHILTGERKPLASLSHSSLNIPAIPDVLGNKDMDFPNISPECIQHLFSPMDENDNVRQEAQSTSPKDDPVKKQKTIIRNKVAKLLAYGSPKPLSPLNSAISPAAFNKFKSPLNHSKH